MPEASGGTSGEEVPKRLLRVVLVWSTYEPIVFRPDSAQYQDHSASERPRLYRVQLSMQDAEQDILHYAVFFQDVLKHKAQ